MCYRFLTTHRDIPESQNELKIDSGMENSVQLKVVKVAKVREGK